MPSRPLASSSPAPAASGPRLDAAVLARLEATWPGRAESERSQAWIDRQFVKVHAALGDKPFCCGGIHLTLADISVCCALAWLDFRFPELDWRSGHPKLEALLARLGARPSFASTVPH